MCLLCPPHSRTPGFYTHMLRISHQTDTLSSLGRSTWFRLIGVSLITGLLITGLDWNGLDWNLKIRFYVLRYAITTKSLPGMFILREEKRGE